MSDALTFPLLTRRRVTGLAFGAMRSRSRGGGIDLAGARPYRPGDDVRRIDWRASARLSSARGSDDFLLREHLAEEATRVVVVVDRSPTMMLYPPELPWLCKPAAVVEASAMIRESALQAGCTTGDIHAGGAHDPLAASLVSLVRDERTLLPGTFVFLLSDFLVFPAEDVWQDALDRGFDLVPVIIQDPLWEQSFPEVGGTVLSLADPATGRLRHVRFSRAQARARREENRSRLLDILRRFDLLGFDSALVSSHDRGRILESFLDWAAVRSRGARLA